MAETTTIARPYAQAVFDIATDAKALGKWSDTLNLLTVIVTEPAMQDLIRNPGVERDRLTGLIRDICGDALDEKGASFVSVLAESRRLEVLPEITTLFEAYRAEAEMTVQAEVTSAVALSDAQQQAIIASLKRRLGREVTLECRTDESIIGGAVIRAGDLVIDGSITSQMEKLAGALSR